MLAKDDRVTGSIHRITIHFLFFHGIELLKLGVLPVAPIGETSKFPSGETAKTLLLGCAMCPCVERTNQELSVIVVKFCGAIGEKDVVDKRCRHVGRGCDHRYGAKLIHGQMQRLIEMTISNWNVAIGSEDDLERRIVGRCGGAKSI